MAVVVVRVGCFLAMPVGQQHDEVGDQIGRRMNTVRDQALRLGENADDDLRGGEHHVHAHAHPGAAGGGGRAFGRLCPSSSGSSSGGGKAVMVRAPVLAI